jgi:hypothetical protein
MQSEPLPAIPIDYSHQLDQTLLRLVRILASLGLVIGSLNVAISPLTWVDPQRRLDLLSSNTRLMSLLSTVMLMGLGVMLIIGCVQCLRRLPQGRRLLLAYAYGYFGYLIFAMGTNILFILEFYGRSTRYSHSYILALIGSMLGRSLSGFSFPLVLSVLLPRPEVRRIFET